MFVDHLLTALLIIGTLGLGIGLGVVVSVTSVRLLRKWLKEEEDDKPEVEK